MMAPASLPIQSTDRQPLVAKRTRTDDWVACVAADGATIGAGVMTLANLCEWLARHGVGDVALFELPRLRLLGWFPEVMLRLGLGLFSRTWQLALASVTLLGLALWRRTRPLSKAVVLAVLALVSAATAALACASAYTFWPPAAFIAVIVAGPSPLCWCAYGGGTSAPR
jgi:hypothetical protein